MNKKVFFTVGPSQLYPTFNKHIKSALAEQISSISHRGQQFKDIYIQTTENLSTLMDIPNDFDIYFTGSSLESMERIIQNTVLKGSFHVVSGSFGKSWLQTSQELGKRAEFIDTPAGEGFDFGSLKIPKTSEVVCITQNDTSTGVQIPMEEIYYLKSKYPEKLLSFDTFCYTLPSTPGVGGR